MSTLEANVALLSTIPEEYQEEIQSYLLMKFCRNNPYKTLSGNEILAELAESRVCYRNGEGEDFDKTLDEIGAKYGYRKIKFAKHKFVMIYRIQDKTVIVDGMFHELQDYEGIFSNELHLQ